MKATGVLHLRAARSSDAALTPPRPVRRCACGQPMLVVCRRMPALPGDVVTHRKPSRVIRPDNPHSSKASTMH
jgi:hypothetical protein